MSIRQVEIILLHKRLFYKILKQGHITKEAEDGNIKGGEQKKKLRREVEDERK